MTKQDNPLSTLQPSLLWKIFADICAIPRPSHHETEITEAVQLWAKLHNIDCEIDKVGNLLLRKQATPGYENRKTVVLQAHLDMVAQKRDNKIHDFKKDPIEPKIVDGWVVANDTTLGADNGIGMASALAILFDNSIEHGPIEVLLTASEETGMVGAFGLAPNWLTADIMINTDAEQEGEVFLGCAGGNDVIIEVPIEFEKIPNGLVSYELSITGLKGGHSGIDIHKGLGNANVLLAGLLSELNNQFEIRLSQFEGGTLRNAIPRKAQAVISIIQADVTKIVSFINHYIDNLKSIYQFKEPNLAHTFIQTTETVTQVFSKSCQKNSINALNIHPNGVIRMSDAAEGVTETSLNLGVINTTENSLKLISLVRSLVDSGKNNLVTQLQSLANLLNANFTTQNDYPGWAPDVNSAMLNIAKNEYKTLFDQELKSMIIHAGLECGLLKKPYPHLDVISIGPTIKRAHSPDEKVEIQSVEKYWNFLTALLKAVPVK